VQSQALVGFKSFLEDDDPEDDEEVGHNTHVVSIAARNFIEGAPLGGDLGSCTAVGIAPLAHDAMYKVRSAK
jgi:hypothetical protein